MPTVFDNIETPFLENEEGNGLRDALKLSKSGDFCVGYFNLRGWKQIDDVVESWKAEDRDPPCRLLVGMQRLARDQIASLFGGTDPDARISNERIIQLKKDAAAEFRNQLTIGLPSSADERGLRRLSKQLKGGKVKVKIHLRHPLHAKLYLAHRADTINPVIAYLGSSNLTLSGLRYQGELNVDVLEKDAAAKLAKWFEDRWDDQWCLDISEELIEIIDQSWAGDRLIPPFHIYLKMAWHLSMDARDGIKEFRIPAEISDDLLPFQVKAVQLACRHLNKRGGVLVGDVVGLGKTRIAAAIARIMGDDQMLECLIICPKNLVSMWEEYAHRFGLRAPKVLSQSQAQKKLPVLPRYRLVIIDESHNFRNREGKIYQAIHEYIEKNDSKVVLLSATPYNKTYLDLGSQLRLFINEQSDLGIRPENLLREVGESQFSLRNPNTPLSSLAAFEKSESSDDWREVMRLFLVRRTRSFIVQNYAELKCDGCNHVRKADVTECPQCGKQRDAMDRPFLTLPDGLRLFFPRRVPKTVKFRSDPEDAADPCAQLFRQDIVTVIDDLDLPRYGLSLYLKGTLPADLTRAELKLTDDLSRAGKRLKGFCRTNLFKRLESSAHAFVLSVHRHILRNYLFLYAVENGLPLPIGQQDATLLDSRFHDAGDGELDLDDGEPDLPPYAEWDEAHYRAEAEKIYNLLSTNHSRRYRWLRTDLFKKTLAKLLLKDARALHGILTNAGTIPEADDFKLQALIRLVGQKFPDDKFILFTQFADTAQYLSDALNAAGIDGVDCVTGGAADPARQAWRFSPESNDKLKEFPPDKQTRVLIATDVLSEGQNLQDANRVINYDLPWAIIRLIQRAGRVDRIGQMSDTINCYSFLPAEGVENLINLRRRLLTRLSENQEVVGSDEAFFENQGLGDTEGLEALYNETSGVLDEPDDDEVDLTSEAYEIWSAAIRDNPAMRKTIESMPDVVFSSKAHEPDPDHPAHTPPGVLTYIHTSDENDALIWVDAEKKTVSESPVRILRQAACDPETPALPRREDHHELVAEATRIVREERRGIATGALGSRRGARYRTYERLNEHIRHREGDLFLTDQIREAIQAVYNHPLTTHAVDKLNRQLRAGIGDDDLAQLVSTLHRDDRLVIVSDKDSGNTNHDPRIVCSMGLVENAPESVPTIQ